MEAENLKKLREIFIAVFSITEPEVKKYSQENNRKWDSLASVTLIAAIESEFNILIDESVYENFTSYEAIELALEKLEL